MIFKLSMKPRYGAGDYIPLMVVTYWTFRIMMTFGFIMMGLTAFFVWAIARGDITQRKMAEVGSLRF